MYVRLVKTFTFEAAHFLPSFPDGHKCRRMHGHSFKVDIIVAGQIPVGQHHLLDYGDIKRAIEPIRAKLDHYCLNEIEGLENPTSERIAKWIWDRLRIDLPQLAEVHVHETCESRCEYRATDQQDDDA
jgi:6-pyruvoyltetrahydropterin/6-carboxytetrahydropterin synthase